MRRRLARLSATVQRSSGRLGGMEDGRALRDSGDVARGLEASETFVVEREAGPAGPGGPSTKISLPHFRHFVRMRLPRTFSSGTA
jgi:hypothetical protein